MNQTHARNVVLARPLIMQGKNVLHVQEVVLKFSRQHNNVFAVKMVIFWLNQTMLLVVHLAIIQNYIGKDLAKYLNQNVNVVQSKKFIQNQIQ